MATIEINSHQYLLNGVSGNVIINDTEIQGGHFPKDVTNTPLFYNGNVASVFPFLKNKKRSAIKIWQHASDQNMKKRYEALHDFLNNTTLPYFTQVKYATKAINIYDTAYDVLIMNWVGRQNLKEYAIANIKETQRIDELAEKVLELHKQLNNVGISHGELHCGNIYVDANNNLKLIDYDALYVPGITNESTIKNTHPDFFHPSQKSTFTSNSKTDYFSALVLYLGLKAIAQYTDLWGRYKIGFHESFIFKSHDFEDLKNSSVYKDIRKIKSPEIDKLLDILEAYCLEKDIQNLKPFYTYLDKHAENIENNYVSEEKKELPIEQKNIQPVIEENNVEKPFKKVYVSLPNNNAPQNENKEALSNKNKIEFEKFITPNVKIEQESSTKNTLSEVAISKDGDMYVAKQKTNTVKQIVENKNISKKNISAVNKPISDKKQSTENATSITSNTAAVTPKNKKGVILFISIFLVLTLALYLFFPVIFPNSLNTSPSQAEIPKENIEKKQTISDVAPKKTTDDTKKNASDSLNAISDKNDLITATDTTTTIIDNATNDTVNQSIPQPSPILIDDNKTKTIENKKQEDVNTKNINTAIEEKNTKKVKNDKASSFKIDAPPNKR